jgi:phosphatidylglycerophosphate synthase
MFDAHLRALVDPPLGWAAKTLSKSGVGANTITLSGAVLGIGAGLAVALQYYLLALALIALNRLLDGLDGMVARINGATAWGGYLDSIADYIFYAALPLGFGFAKTGNQLPALVLLASFVLSAVSFLAFAAIAAQSGIKDDNQQKAFYYSSGLIEGAETIAFFLVMCLVPTGFAFMAYLLAFLCVLTVGQRLRLAWRVLA